MPGRTYSLTFIQYTNVAIYTLIVIVALLFLFTTVKTIQFPYGVGYGEAQIVNHANRFWLGEDLYKNDFNSPPYIVTNYPPIYFILLSLVKSVFGIDFFVGGRIISIVSTAISSIIITLISYKITHKLHLSAIALGLFLGHPYIIAWSSVARVDLLALMFSLIGVYVGIFRNKSKNNVILATLLFTASFFTRQTYILAGPLCVSIWLYRYYRKKFHYFVILMLLTNFVVFISLNIFTSNGFFLNIITANINEFSLSRLSSMFLNFLFISPFLILLIISILAIRRNNFHKQYNKIEGSIHIKYFLVPYTIGAFLSALTVGKVGSDINYFLEMIVAIILLTMYVINRTEILSKKIKSIYQLAIFGQLIWIIVIIISVNITNVLSEWRNIERYDILYQSIKAATYNGIVLTDDYLDMVVLTGQQIYYQPFEYGQLFKAGIWKAKRLEEQIAAKEFPLIVVGGVELEKECCWPRPISDAIEDNYDIQKLEQILLCVPSNR